MKVKELQKIMVKKGIDACLFFNLNENKKDSFVTYFSGLDNEFIFVCIKKSGEPFIIASPLEVEICKKNGFIKDVVCLDGDLFSLLKEKIRKFDRIGLNFNLVSLNEKKLLGKKFNCKFVDVSKNVINLMECKTDFEINLIKKACKYTDDIFSKVVKNFDRFVSEIDIKNFILKEIMNLGLEPSFDIAVNSGVNASHIHYKTMDCKIKKGFLVIDFGIKYKNYNSDMTRTLYFGNPSKNEIDAYNRVLDVQLKCIDSIKVGVKFKDIDKIARDHIGNDKLIHALGHGLGLSVHEMPNVGPKSKEKIMNGHVFTIEPGEYVKDRYGIRIEDDVCVINGKAEVLSKSQKKLITIKN